MGRSQIALAAAVALASVILRGPALADGDPIQARKANFHVLSGEVQTVVKGLGNGVPIASMRPAVLAAQRALANIPGLFPSGSGEGDTDALPVIWTDPAGFTLAYDTASARMAELVLAADGTDHDRFGAAVGRLAAACGSCHSAFRAN